MANLLVECSAAHTLISDHRRSWREGNLEVFDSDGDLHEERHFRWSNVQRWSRN